jgi:hypothetical protein
MVFFRIIEGRGQLGRSETDILVALLSRRVLKGSLPMGAYVTCGHGCLFRQYAAEMRQGKSYSEEVVRQKSSFMHCAPRAYAP